MESKPYRPKFNLIPAIPCEQALVRRVQSGDKAGMTDHDSLATHNERVKLFAGFLNALALGMIGFAVIRPLVDGLANADWPTLWWGSGGLVMHGVSHYVMRYLRKEAS